MNDAEIHELIYQHSKAFQVWLNGYEAGHLAGQESQRLSNEQAAELAARRFLALDAHEVDHRRFAKQTFEGLDMVAARNAPGSAYVRRAA